MQLEKKEAIISLKIGKEENYYYLLIICLLIRKIQESELKASQEINAFDKFVGEMLTFQNHV